MNKVLVIDDDKSIRKAVKAVLVTNGYKVIEAPDAVMVIDILMREKSNIGAVVLDMQIPEVDGRDIHEIVTEYAPMIPIIIFSVLPIAEQKLKVRKAREYCQKTGNYDEIAAKVKSILPHPTSAQKI
ncbi:MAG: response regulator [Candidatus Omnitrophica bacterium]|nr:response regulator [Candidatus Omnitrophota bacterium]